MSNQQAAKTEGIIPSVEEANQSEHSATFLLSHELILSEILGNLVYFL
jgi:hypothetical protein